MTRRPIDYDTRVWFLELSFDAVADVPEVGPGDPAFADVGRERLGEVGQVAIADHSSLSMSGSDSTSTTAGRRSPGNASRAIAARAASTRSLVPLIEISTFGRPQA